MATHTWSKIENRYDLDIMMIAIRRIIGFLGFLLLAVFSAFAQESGVSWFHEREFGAYFLSDITSPLIQLEAGLGTNHSEYNINVDRTGKYILYNESVLGGELPVANFNWNRSSLALSIPVSATVWFDFTEKWTEPVLNTDYRFSAMEFNYLMDIDHPVLHNLSIKFSPYIHESTHLGDELVLYRQRAGFPITRINVTFEVYELAVTLNDPKGTSDNYNTLRVGFRGLWVPRHGFYSTRPEETDTSKVDISKNRFEGYIQFESQRTSGFLASKQAANVLSLELRARVQYSYPYYEYDPISSIGLREFTHEERYVPCLNGFFGWRFNSENQRYGRMGAYLKYYHGINPHGQFRNLPRYDFIGLAVVYEPYSR